MLSTSFLHDASHFEQECQTYTKHAHQICGKFNGNEDLMQTVALTPYTYLDTASHGRSHNTSRFSGV